MRLLCSEERSKHEDCYESQDTVGRGLRQMQSSYKSLLAAVHEGMRTGKGKNLTTFMLLYEL